MLPQAALAWGHPRALAGLWGQLWAGLDCCGGPWCRSGELSWEPWAGWQGVRGHGDAPAGSPQAATVLAPKGKGGILALLDEECLRPGTVSPATFLAKLDQAFGNHKHYESRKSQSDRRITDTSLPSTCFRVHHYAGKVRPGWGQGTVQGSRQHRAAGCGY